MEIIRSIRAMQRRADEIRRSGKTIGVVPTMGSLHEGHTSLIRIARGKSDVVVTTVFVNPTQFGPGEDFERYPRDLERDAALAEEAGTDLIFAPGEKEMYPEGFSTSIVPQAGVSILEGAVRPDHFRGVATVVAKLFHATKPHVAVFGQKDAQQAFVVGRMIRDLNLDIELIVAPIVREPDGLAKSSRNVYLTAEDREKASVLHRALKKAESMIVKGERKAEVIRSAVLALVDDGKPTNVDYFSIVDPETFKEVGDLQPPSVLVLLAVRFGSTRLIDNMLLPVTPERE